MKAIELADYGGLESLRLIDTEKPKPTASEILIEVKAAGINFAELELTKGDYKVSKTPPFIMGFEAAGVVVEVGSQVQNVEVGDRVTSVVTSGGFAEYATANANAAVPIPAGVSFAQATTIPIQGVSAYCLLKYGANLKPTDTVLVQSAAGGVGLYLVQLAKILGVGKIIALASSGEKLELLRKLGADVLVDYSDPKWPGYGGHEWDRPRRSSRGGFRRHRKGKPEARGTVRADRVVWSEKHSRRADPRDRSTIDL
jgi:NADPH:quinone reductase